MSASAVAGGAIIPSAQPACGIRLVIDHANAFMALRLPKLAAGLIVAGAMATTAATSMDSAATSTSTAKTLCIALIIVSTCRGAVCRLVLDNCAGVDSLL